ncbi:MULTISPECIES: hypothetical protein [unclassified Aureispira]|uniref:hypothetical protein n=1 Tax=unclassified Aureispira TaxID=2649989 RepID=UPI000695EE37|nr:MULTISPECIES: hypothetical protein [unclassified Aureispira]WMX13395.1 hypothetical protein QP953_21345 [Aureispira sp. CCB-E]
MKITTICLLLFISFVHLQAQDELLTNDKGQVIVPEKGDIGLGVNMIPVFYWLGNSFNSTANNNYANNDKFFAVFGNSVLIGKYMLTNQSALRLAWGINLGHSVKEQYIQDDASNDPSTMVKDSRTLNWSQASLGLGYEMRKGKGRLQGFWGGDIRLTYNQSSDYRYTYGNGYSLSNLVPTSYDWGTNLNGNKRTIAHTGLNAFGVGLRGFVGAEYFVAPKVCIGAEFGWGVMYQHTLATTISEEYFNVVNQEVAVEHNYIAAKNEVTAGVDNFDGTIYLMFFFNTNGQATPQKSRDNVNKTEKKSKKSVRGNSRF